jgi:hypothetical protein
MIRGYYIESVRRPVVDAVFSFDDYPGIYLQQTLLIDTGSARTIIAPRGTIELQRLGISSSVLPTGGQASGIGGATLTRVARGAIRLETVEIRFDITVMEMTTPPNFMPSILGRDILDQFVLVINRQAREIWLLQ